MGYEELRFNGNRVSIWEYENVLEIDGGDGCATMCMHLMPVKSTLKYLK